MSTKTIRLGSGECDEFKEEGFSCIEHYQCAGDDLRLMTDGESQTRLETSIYYLYSFLLFRVVSIITKVSVEQEGPGFSTKYGFSIVDATDKKCKTYSQVNFHYLFCHLILNQQEKILKVCCGKRRKSKDYKTTKSTTEATTSKSTTTTTSTPKPTKKPCESKFSKPVAGVKGLALYTDEPKEFDEDCIIEHDVEHFSKKPHPETSDEGNDPCKKPKSVVDVVIPYSFGNCTVNDYQPQCGRHNEVIQ